MICAPAAKRQASAWVDGAEGRERREDGADDHPPRRGKLGVCVRTVSPRRSRIRINFMIVANRLPSQLDGEFRASVHPALL
jgi:hypothetical protein